MDIESERSGAPLERQDNIVPLRPLAMKARAGDTQALERLLALVLPYIRRVATRRLHDEVEVEDCIQDTLIALTTALRRFRGDSTVLYFVHQVTTRTANNMQRRARQRERPADASADPEASCPDWPLDLVFGAEQRAALTELLNDLPESQANALLLREGLDYSLQEAASAEGVSVHTLRSRVRQAKRVLRRKAANDARVSELLRPP